MSNTIDTKNHATVKALAEHQDRLAISGERFAKRYLKCSGGTWSQLKSGTYPADPTRWIEAGEGALVLLQDEEAAAAKSGGPVALLPLSDHKATLNAVSKCSDQVRNRLVVFLADTGGGKTALGKQVREKYRASAVCLEATECWRNNYYAVIRCFAEALDLGDDLSTALKAETAVIDALSISPCVISIDEAHYLGPAALNFVKLILNKTKCRVLMMAMPQLWTRMEGKNWEETRQLRNRTYTKILLQEIPSADARAYLGAKVPGFAALEKELAKQIIGACLAACNPSKTGKGFGLYNTLQGICEELTMEAGAALTLETTKLAIERVEALRG